MSQKNPYSGLARFLGAIQEKKMKTQKTKGVLSQSEMERKNLLDLNLVVGVDCSGSISGSMFNAFMAQLQAIKGMSRIKVVEVGSNIRAVYDFECGTKRSIVRRQGGGGNGEHVFFPFAKNMKPDAILYMTDGYCVPTKDPGIPTAWILTKEGKKPYDWGSVEGRLAY